MNRSFLIFITILIGNLSLAMAQETTNWDITLNEYISAMVNFTCIEKRSSDLNKCNIPIDRCRRFTTLVAKRCLGEEIAKENPTKHPKSMTEKELLDVIDKAAVCTGKTVPIITYYVCPEQHERSWARNNKWLGYR